jgi:hypothetical protein
MARPDSTRRPLEVVRATADSEARYAPQGEPERLELLPPMPESEIERLAGRIPCPLLASVRELLQHTRGFATAPLRRAGKAPVFAYQRRLRGERLKAWLGLTRS